MTTITKTGSSSRVEIKGSATGSFHASHIQGTGHDVTYLQGKTFSTEAGARRWAAKVLA